VYSSGQAKVIQSLVAKYKKADDLFSKLNNAINELHIEEKNNFTKKMTLPRFL